MSKKIIRNNKGFTLVELMVVIVIIGILTAIALPIYNNAQKNAANQAHAANIRVLEEAASICVSTEGVPGSSVSWSSAASDADDTHKWEDYVKEWPDVPSEATKNPDGSSLKSSAVYTVTIGTDGAITVDGF